MQQQFGRSQRIGNANRAGCDRAAARELLDDDRVRVGGELEAPVLLRDDHREEFLLDDVVPDVFRHVAEFVVDRPVVDHAAQLFAWAVHESLFFLGQFRRREGHELVPFRHAREQFAVPPDAAGFERFAFGARHRRQHLAVDLEQRFGDLLAAYLDQVGHDHDPEQDPQQDKPPPRAAAEHGVGDKRGAGGDRGSAQVYALVGEKDTAADEQQRPEQASGKSRQNEDLY